MVKDIGKELNMGGPEQQPTSSRSPSLNKGGIFRFATDQRTATGAPPIEIPTKKKLPDKREIQPTPTSRKNLHLRLIGTLAALLATTAGPATHHQITNEWEVSSSSVTRDVISIPGFYWNFGKGVMEDVRRLLHLEAPISPFFDNKADTQTIKAGVNTESLNISQLPPNEEEHVGSPIQIILPLKLGDNQEVNYTTQERYVNVRTMQGNDPTTSVETRELEFLGYNLVIPDKGTEFIVPPDIQNAKALIVDYPMTVNGENRYSWLLIKWKEKDGNFYTLGFNWDSDVRQVDFTELTTNAPVWKPGSVNPAGKPVEEGKSILRTVFNNARVKINLSIIRPDGSGELIPFDFKTTTNNGVQKLIVAK